MTDTIQARLTALGIDLPQAATPVANYVPYMITGDLVYISGQVTVWDGKMRYTGKVGSDLSVEDGQKAARTCALNLLAQLKAACGGNLDRVETAIRLTGYVNCPSDFTDHAVVMNGASDLMVEVMGEKGKHTRAAVGCSSLPLDSAVEVDGIFKLA